MKRLACILLLAALLLLAGCAQQGAAGTQPTTAPPVSHPILSMADFDQIEAGMLLTDAVKILGYKGKYEGGYIYTTSENREIMLYCDKIDENLPQYDSNLIITCISVRDPDGTWHAIDRLEETS